MFWIDIGNIPLLTEGKSRRGEQTDNASTNTLHPTTSQRQ